MTKDRIYKSKHLTSLVFPKYFVLKNKFKINFFPLDFVNVKKKKKQQENSLLIHSFSDSLANSCVLIMAYYCFSRMLRPKILFKACDYSDQDTILKIKNMFKLAMEENKM